MVESSATAAGGKPAEPTRLVKSPARDRVSNGSALLHGVDGRNVWVRRCKAVIESHIADLGGLENTSSAERSIVRRAAVLTTELERLEVKFALAGEASSDDLDLYQRTAGNMRRLLETIGVRRRPRDVTPTLGEILSEASDQDAEQIDG